MRNWKDLLPDSVARDQEMWERNSRVYRAIEAGLSFAAAGRLVGRSGTTAKYIWLKFSKYAYFRTPPIERYFSQYLNDFEVLSGQIRPPRIRNCTSEEVRIRRAGEKERSLARKIARDKREQAVIPFDSEGARLWREYKREMALANASWQVPTERPMFDIMGECFLYGIGSVYEFLLEKAQERGLSPVSGDIHVRCGMIDLHLKCDNEQWFRFRKFTMPSAAKNA